MGLDMFARKTTHKPEKEVDFTIPRGGSEELYYWRKHPDLHGWMEALYYKKGGISETFNSGDNVMLTELDIVDLEAVVELDALPPTQGFFFGESRPEDREDDRKFIKKAREALAAGFTVYYTSWW